MLYLFNVSKHCFESRETYRELKVWNSRLQSSVTLSNDSSVHDALWIPGSTSEVIYLVPGREGETRILVGDGQDVAREHYQAATIPASVQNLKLASLPDGSVALVVTGMVSKSGDLLNKSSVAKRQSARVYDSMHVQNVSPVTCLFKEYTTHFVCTVGFVL